MEWTFTKPTQPGAYFYRLAGQPGPQLAGVYWHGKNQNRELRARLTGTRLEYPVTVLSGEFAGPIPEPQEKR